MEERRKEEQKGGKKKWPLIVAIIIILILLAIIIFLLWPKDEKRNVVITENNIDEVISNVEEKDHSDPGYYTVTMTNDWHFSTGDAASTDAVVENINTNATDVYFDIVMADDEEHVILKSPVIPVGSKLTNITLDEDLEPGTYDAVCIYHLVDEEQNTLSTVRVSLTIIVEG